MGNYRGGIRKNCQSDFSAIILPKMLTFCSYRHRKLGTFFVSKKALAFIFQSFGI